MCLTRWSGGSYDIRSAVAQNTGGRRDDRSISRTIRRWAIDFVSERAPMASAIKSAMAFHRLAGLFSNMFSAPRASASQAADHPPAEPGPTFSYRQEILRFDLRRAPRKDGSSRGTTVSRSAQAISVVKPPLIDASAAEYWAGDDLKACSIVLAV